MPTFEQILLDTDIVIHLLRKRPDTVERFLLLHESGVEFLLSPIVVAEINAGAFEREIEAIEGFFALCHQLPLDMATARRAGRYARGYRKAYQGISLEDYFLAATAREFECPLWTGNCKHYPMDDIELLPDD